MDTQGEIELNTKLGKWSGVPMPYVSSWYTRNMASIYANLVPKFRNERGDWKLVVMYMDGRIGCSLNCLTKPYKAKMWRWTQIAGSFGETVELAACYCFQKYIDMSPEELEQILEKGAKK